MTDKDLGAQLSAKDRQFSGLQRSDTPRTNGGVEPSINNGSSLHGAAQREIPLFTLKAKTLEHVKTPKGEVVDVTGEVEVKVDPDEYAEIAHKPLVNGEIPLNMLSRSLLFGRTRHRPQE